MRTLPSMKKTQIDAADDRYENMSLGNVNKIKGQTETGAIISEYLKMRLEMWDSSGYGAPSKSTHVYAETIK